MGQIPEQKIEETEHHVVESSQPSQRLINNTGSLNKSANVYYNKI